MHQLFTIMNDKEDSVHYLIQFLSTHPKMDKRIEYTKELVSKKEVNVNVILKEKWEIIKEEL